MVQNSNERLREFPRIENKGEMWELCTKEWSLSKQEAKGLFAAWIMALEFYARKNTGMFKCPETGMGHEMCSVTRRIIGEKWKRKDFVDDCEGSGSLDWVLLESIQSPIYSIIILQEEYFSEE